MDRKKSRIYASGTMAALNHPMRVTLYDLICDVTLKSKNKDDGITAPEMAEILNENRINLYHHLEILENTGLIKSFYKGNRMKKYRKVSEVEEEKHEKSKIGKGEKLGPDRISKTQTMILTPPQDEKKFKEKVKELIKSTGANWDSDMNILQVHIHWQWKNVVAYKHKQIRQVRKLYKKGK
jgi:DNA-binding transcriptional ArsR family regulator